MRLPNHRFDPCVIRPAAQVDKYQTVAFGTNRYSVPRPYAFQMVTIKGYVDRVVVVAADQVIATHPRCLKRHTLVLDPIHYLATLMRKPGALDHSPVYRELKLRAELEELHGTLSGSRGFVRVMQLLADHPLPRVQKAVEACRREQLISVEAVIQRTHTLAASETQTPRTALDHGTHNGAAGRGAAPRPELL